MRVDIQRLNYKIQPTPTLSQHHYHHILANSKLSFTNINTPGWTSIVNSDIRSNQASHIHQQPIQLNSHKSHSQIQQKLAQLKTMDLTEKKFEKLRVPLQKILTVSSKWESNENQPVSFQNKIKNESSSTIKIPNHMNENSLSKSTIIKDTKIQRNSRKTAESSVRKQPNRFKQITIHEHLYLESKKLETKKLVQKALDEELKKHSILSFTPTINSKSYQLAESKYSRIKERQEEEILFKQITQKEEIGECNKASSEIDSYFIMNNLFSYLSRGNNQISQESINQIVQELPLPCLAVLENILKKIYTGECIGWVDFVSHINQEKLGGSKANFLKLMEKWMKYKGLKKERQDQSEAVNHSELHLQ